MTYKQMVDAIYRQSFKVENDIGKLCQRAAGGAVELAATNELVWDLESAEKTLRESADQLKVLLKVCYQLNPED
jgi:hypothetical protein